MDKKAAKNALATSFEKGEQEAFNESLANYLEFIDSKEEFNEFVEFITFHAVRDMINDESLLKKVRYFVKDKIFELLLNRGDTPSSKHIALYSIFKGSPHIEDERLDKYIAFADANATNKDLGDMEKMYLIYLRFVLSFIRGDDDSLVVFFKWLLTLNIHKVELPGEEIAVREFLSKLKDLDIGEVFKALDELFDVDHYFSLSTGERRSIYNWCLHTLWNIPRLFNDRRWVEMYPKWKTLLYKHLELDEIDQAMYLQFYIYHKMGNSFQTQKEWKMFNDEISSVTARYYKEWAEKNSLLQAKTKESEGKKLIGIIKDRIVENSPFKVEYSMLKQVMKDEEFRKNYDVKIYNMSYIEKSLNYDQQVSELRSLGIEIFDAHQPFYGDGYYFSHLQKALYIREKIISDGVDIAIFPISGYDISDFLVSTRVAPKQIFWSHGNFEYDIDGVDKRITHISEKSHRIESSYEYEFFDVESDEKYLGLEEEKYKEEADKVRSRFDEGTVILGSIGRLVKVDSKEYLEAAAKIMHECPNTVYLACGVGNVDSIKAQVEELGIADRFYFEGWIDPDVYGYVIDVYLDTFPESGGQSLVEYGKKNHGLIFNKVLLDEDNLASDFIERVKDLKVLNYYKYLLRKSKSNYNFVHSLFIEKRSLFDISKAIINNLHIHQLPESNDLEINAQIPRSSTPKLGYVGPVELVDNEEFINRLLIMLNGVSEYLLIFCTTGDSSAFKSKLIDKNIIDKSIFVDIQEYKTVIHEVDILLDSYPIGLMMSAFFDSFQEFSAFFDGHFVRYDDDQTPMSTRNNNHHQEIIKNHIIVKKQCKSLDVSEKEFLDIGDYFKFFFIDRFGESNDSKWVREINKISELPTKDFMPLYINLILKDSDKMKINRKFYKKQSNIAKQNLENDILSLSPNKINFYKILS